MTETTLVAYLIGATFALAIALGIYQWQKAVKARREHHHSVAERKDMKQAMTDKTSPAPQGASTQTSKRETQ